MSEIIMSKIVEFRNLATLGNIKLLIDNAIRALALPVLGIFFFLLLWQMLANNIVTSLGQFPGPTQVMEQSQNLVSDHNRERQKNRLFMSVRKNAMPRSLKKIPMLRLKLGATPA